jgi:hypothetical protein
MINRFESYNKWHKIQTDDIRELFEASGYDYKLYETCSLYEGYVHPSYHIEIENDFLEDYISEKLIRICKNKNYLYHTDDELDSNDNSNYYLINKSYKVLGKDIFKVLNYKSDRIERNFDIYFEKIKKDLIDSIDENSLIIDKEIYRDISNNFGILSNEVGYVILSNLQEEINKPIYYLEYYNFIYLSY